MNKYIHRKILRGKTCLWTFESPGKKANVLGAEFLAELDSELSWLEHESSITGLLIESGKPGIFLAGADLKALSEASVEEFPALIETGQNLFNRLEALPIPKATLVNGACLGGGLELALATDWRIASMDNSTKLGLPEVNLGLLPAWGGCTRLPKLVGFPKALSAILAGKVFNAKQAKRTGIVDEVVHKENLVEAGLKYLAKGRRKKKHHLANVTPIPQIMAWKACKELVKKTHGNYPAPLAALKVVAGSTLYIPRVSMEGEKKEFTKLAGTAAHKSLLRLHFLREQARRNPGARSAGGEPKEVRYALVLGGGIMGSGIAHWLSSRGIHVVLEDVFPDVLAKGMAHIRSLYAKAVSNKIMTPVEAQHGLDLITPVSGDVSLDHVDLVIEAIVEDLELKQKVLGELEAKAPASTLIATNTSCLPISEIGKNFKDPSRLIGLHFFNPVLKMPLLEVIKAKHTSEESLARGFEFAHKIGKIPVYSKDRPGFLVNRILIPYLLEALKLFESGEDVKRIDKLMLDFGMPMGPLRLIDEIGVDTSLHVSKFLVSNLKDSGPLPDILGKMVEAGFLGKKSGLGFYSHTPGKPTVPNPGLAALGWKASKGLPWQNLLDRMVFSMVNEAARCVDEGVALSADDVDLAMVLGAGWCPHLGGPLNYARNMGYDKVAATMRDLAMDSSPHFRPAASLETNNPFPSVAKASPSKPPQRKRKSQRKRNGQNGDTPKHVIPPRE